MARSGKAQGQDAVRSATQSAAAEERRAQAQVRSVTRVNAQIARLEASAAADADRRRQKSVRADMRGFDDRMRASKKAHDAEERDVMRVVAASERADKRKAASSQRESTINRNIFAREFGRRTVSNLGQTARFGMGVAGQLARGAGVNLDIGASAARNVELEKRAIDLSNSGYNPNAAEGDSSRIRVDQADIQKNVKESADANAFSRTEAMEGLQAFVGKTGDLKTGMGVMKELGALSRATGTDLGDMVEAAGDVSSVLGDMKGEDKIKRIGQVMRSIAGQGKLGAVELKDLATQMAKVSVAATAFDGKTEDNIVLMGAFAQLARQKGGATTANIAASSVSGMVNTFRTPARMAAFKKEGIDVINQDTGMIRNPEELLKAALAKTGGDPERFKKLYYNSSGARAVEGSANTFRRARNASRSAGGSEDEATSAGLKAVTEELDKFKKVAMGEGEIRESLGKALESQSAKAQQFNNRMDDVTAGLQAKLAPALERAAPGLIKLAEALSHAIAWAVDNPGKAITLAIVGSIAKAGLETAISSGMASLLKKMIGGGAGASVAPGVVPGGAGAAGKVLPVAGAALVGFAAGAALDSMDEEADRKAYIATQGSLNEGSNAASRLRMSMGGSAAEQEGALAEGMVTVQRLGSEIIDSKSQEQSVFDYLGGGYASAAGNWASGGRIGQSLDEQSAQEEKVARQPELEAQMVAVQTAIDNLTAKMGGNINVTVTNQPTPGVDPAGRAPPPSP